MHHSSGKIVPELYIKSINEKAVQTSGVRNVKWQKTHLKFVKDMQNIFRRGKGQMSYLNTENR